MITVARELARYKLDLLDVQEVIWDKWGSGLGQMAALVVMNLPVP